MPESFPFDPDWVIAPGATLDDWREETNLGIKSMARICHMSPEEYKKIVAGKRPITRPIAAKLQSATQIPASLWLKLERTYREGLRRGKIDATHT